MAISPAIRQAIRSAIRQAIGDGENGSPGLQLIVTPSTANPVAGAFVDFETNADELGTPVAFEWDFGDGTIPVTGATPSHYFVGLGPYTVTCTVTYDDDSTDTDTQVITIDESSVVSKTNKPYTAGTIYALASWTLSNVSFTANTTVAPDGTTTAGTLTENTATGYHQVYKASPSGFSVAGNTNLVFYVKNIDAQIISVAVYNGGGQYCFVELDLLTGELGQAVGTASIPFRTGSVVELEDHPGWYRVAMSFQNPGSIAYVWFNLALTGTTYDGDGNSAPYLGASRSVYLWGVNVNAGIDDFTEAAHYLGDVQTPAPTTTVFLPASTSGQTLIDYSVFDQELDDDNYASRGWASFAGNITLYPRSVGASVAGSDGFGTHGVTESEDWYALFPNTRPGFIHQVGAWFYFDRMPGGNLMLVGQQWLYGYRNGLEIGADRKLYWREFGQTPVEIRATLVPQNQWFWVGFACKGDGTGLVKMYKEIGSATETLSGGATACFDTTNGSPLVGHFNAAFNIDHTGRISCATFHTLNDISDAGYPGEVVPPQEVPYVYSVDPSSGDDSNNGIDAPWQTVAKLNAMLLPTGIPSSYDDSADGLGAQIHIDTSAQMFDVGLTGIKCYRDHLRIKASTGNTWIRLKAYVDIDAGDWTVTGGYSNIYQTPCADFDSTRLFCKDDHELYALKADLAALDAASEKSYCWVADVLYMKLLSNPITNGKEYLYTRIREGSIGDPALGVCADKWLFEDIQCLYTAYDNNGSYAVGDIPNTYTSGSPGSGTLRHFDFGYADKHEACWTQNATGRTILTENGTLGPGFSQPLTSYMSAGSGNTHIYRNITIVKDWLRENMPDGDYGFGAFYTHGGYGAYDLVWIDQCDWGAVKLLGETAPYLLKITDSTFGLLGVGCALEIDGCTFQLFGESYSQSIANNFRLRNSVILDNGGSSFHYGLSASNVLESDYNEYHIAAATIFAKQFDAGLGGGPLDYTFAQWQALGYDTHSTRLDP